jgi:inner membrane protein
VASALSHAVVAGSIGYCFYGKGAPTEVWAGGILCSVLPDLDVIGFNFGVRYGDFIGHRGFTHSILFAVLLGSLALLIVHGRLPELKPLRLWMYFVLAAASHGLLDSMTNGGLGVAFFAPFDNSRYFLPWTPIQVSPISVSRFLTARGIAVLRTEIVWIWVPAGVLTVIAWLIRRHSTSVLVA